MFPQIVTKYLIFDEFKEYRFLFHISFLSVKKTCMIPISMPEILVHKYHLVFHITSCTSGQEFPYRFHCIFSNVTVTFLAGPATILLDLQGVTGCLDPVLYTWLSYVPRIRLNAPSAPGGTSPSVPADPQGSHGAGASPRENVIGRDAVMSPVSNVSKGMLSHVQLYLSQYFRTSL